MALTNKLLMNLFNLLLFQGLWFFTVLSAAADKPLSAAVLIIGVASGYTMISNSPLRQGCFFLITAAIELCVDSIFINLRILDINAIQLGSLIVSPPFMIALWINLATTFQYSLNWIQGRFILGSIFGGIGGASSYYAGVKLNAAQLGQPEWVSLLAIAAVWSVTFPLLQLIWIKFYAPAN